MVSNIDEYNAVVGLVVKEDVAPTNFEKAYVIYNNQQIEVEVHYSDTYTCGYFLGQDVAEALVANGYIDGIWEVNNSVQTFLLVKDGDYYYGRAELRWPC